VKNTVPRCLSDFLCLFLWRLTVKKVKKYIRTYLFTYLVSASKCTKKLLGGHPDGPDR